MHNLRSGVIPMRAKSNKIKEEFTLNEKFVTPKKVFIRKGTDKGKWLRKLK